MQTASKVSGHAPRCPMWSGDMDAHDPQVLVVVEQPILDKRYVCIELEDANLARRRLLVLWTVDLRHHHVWPSKANKSIGHPRRSGHEVDISRISPIRI